MSTRQSKRVKNLEEEVELIFSQDESDQDCKTTVNVDEIIPKTPSQTKRTKYVATPRPRPSQVQELLQTPRRSCRKSIKPSQDYEDIVNKTLRSSTLKSRFPIGEKEEDDENQIPEIVAPKWTPAKVGRVSQKRSRKSRRTGKAKHNDENEAKPMEGQENSLKKGKPSEEVQVPKEINIFSKDIIEQNEKVEQIECNATAHNSGNENIVGQLSEFILEEIAKEDNQQTEPHKAIVLEVIKKREQLEEMVNDMEHLNVKSEYHIQETDNEINEVFKEHESLILVQESSEDCEEFSEKSEQQAICIVYENNISNNEIENVNETMSLDVNSNAHGKFTGEASFGSYLKSKEINLSDLGLNPLKEEEEEKLVIAANRQIKSSSQETEEMPSLIICADEDEEIRPSDKLNETFETNDSVKILDDINESNKKLTEDVMETLLLSDDDCETPRKRPRIILTETEPQNRSNLSTPKNFAIKAKIPSCPKALLSTPKMATAAKQPSKPYRFPTPYINKKSLRFNSEVKENNAIENTIKNRFNTSIISLTSLEPKEIVLQGIRKRSFSVCIEGAQQTRQKLANGALAKVKKDRVVSFYSPANQTVVIDDLDIKLSKSLKKEQPQENENSNKFVTTRRKRSISFDESMISKSFLPRPVANIESKSQTSSSVSKPTSRTKLPNFAAIHQKQFQKMENLVEHVNRKKERSNNLINSITKLKPVSAQKNVSINNNRNNISTGKPKAVKKIDLGNISQMNKSLLNSTVAAATTKTKRQEASETQKIINLPDPRCDNKIIKLGTNARRPLQQQISNKCLKPSKTVNTEKPQMNARTVAPPKPAFNLSTSLMVKPVTSSNFIENANTSNISGDKMSSRLQRHMDLFKGRTNSTRTAVTSRKNDGILKGVRSNRRFELQMQHRKNLEQ